MHFLAYPLTPAVGAAGIVSPVQLPAVGRSAFVVLTLTQVNGCPLPAPAQEPRRPYAGPAQHRAQHRAQCRAACLSKANF